MWLQYCAAVALGAALAMLVTIPSLDPEAIRCSATNDSGKCASSKRVLRFGPHAERDASARSVQLSVGGRQLAAHPDQVSDTEICRRAKHLHSYRHAVRLYVRTRGSVRWRNFWRKLVTLSCTATRTVRTLRHSSRRTTATAAPSYKRRVAQTQCTTHLVRKLARVTYKRRSRFFFPKDARHNEPKNCVCVVHIVLST